MKNTRIPHSMLQKKHNAINDHAIREAFVAGILRVGKEDGMTDLADLFTKVLKSHEHWYCSCGILAMLTTLVAGRLWVQILTNHSCVLPPPASYMGLVCQDGYIALRCQNSELYDNLLRKIKSIYLFTKVLTA
jgi:hypothetical protein